MITKMILVPAETQIGGIEEPEPEQNLEEIQTKPEIKPMEVEGKKRIERNPQKIQKLLQIILKIAMNNAYTENLEIKNKQGNPIADSNICDLLNSAISHQKALIGEQDFIRILFESKVDSNLIINENMRSKLINFRPIKIAKRSKLENEDIPIKRKKTDENPWEVPLPDDDGEDI